VLELNPKIASAAATESESAQGSMLTGMANRMQMRKQSISLVIAAILVVL
jgi:hypothetical protein